MNALGSTWPRLEMGGSERDSWKEESARLGQQGTVLAVRKECVMMVHHEKTGHIASRSLSVLSSKTAVDIMLGLKRREKLFFFFQITRPTLWALKLEPGVQ